MSPVWDAVDARARGLGTRLLSREQLENLTRLSTAELSAACRRLGLPLAGDRETATPAELELAVRRWAGAALRTLARWAGPLVPTLAVIYEAEDRRSLRALMRGALRGAPAEDRLFALVPTPSLPERALEELARQPTPAAIAVLLLAWRNPYGAALAPAATSPEPDSFALDIALDRTFAARALDATRRGGRALQAFVRQSIDLDNTVTALILAGAESDFMPKQAFLPGGDRVTLAAFEHAVALRDPPAAAHRLAEVLAPSAVAATLRRSRGDASLEDEVLRVRIHELERWSRREPLGPIPVLLFALRLRAQVIDLQRVVWGGALDAPAVDLGAALVTAP